MLTMPYGKSFVRNKAVANKLRDEDLVRIVAQSYVTHGGSTQAISQETGISYGTVKHYIKAAREKGFLTESDVYSPIESALKFPVIPDEDLSAEEILAHMQKAFNKRLNAEAAKKWFKIEVQENLPIAINWFGDPHLGSNGCNVGLLQRDVKIVAATPGMYGANIGDTVDNWAGRLVRLYAENDVSRRTERVLARWFLQESGIRWLLWLEGNHDTMDGEFAQYLRTLNAAKIPMHDWRAQFIVAFPNGIEVRVDAAHDHKGHSMYNDLQGQERASFFEEPADLYIAGHRHTFAYKVKEMADGRVVLMARVRGYKMIDGYAKKWQFPNNQQGASGVVILDPLTKCLGERMTFCTDVQAGANKLTYLREMYSKVSDV